MRWFGRRSSAGAEVEGVVSGRGCGVRARVRNLDLGPRPRPRSGRGSCASTPPLPSTPLMSSHPGDVEARCGDYGDAPRAARGRWTTTDRPTTYDAELRRLDDVL